VNLRKSLDEIQNDQSIKKEGQGESIDKIGPEGSTPHWRSSRKSKINTSSEIIKQEDLEFLEEEHSEDVFNNPEMSRSYKAEIYDKD